MWEPYTMQDDKLMSLDCPCAFERVPNLALTDFLQSLLARKVQDMYPDLPVPHRP